jgi:hypothetical protein
MGGSPGVNLCRGCGQDFAGLTLFDQHRVGVHAHTLTEGLRMDPPREDGRRCLTVDEMQVRGWKQDRQGRWRGAAPESRVWASGKRKSAALSR